ncbi:DUF397 domain-containing protein [Streptomyces rochei]|uniref:DUF397 domain-containing protein n=1 Tax=Streptomyces vinaceusdrappus TaxID=67376 RepID=A0ABY6BSN7_9ACTN|nr:MULTISPECIES: DUF397 domain-containing protein [Streptomyces]MDV6289879.1 DUF397 domain-containing protein [Streptomyces sp. UP1A-1]KYK10571.1 DUF397 domain-containing protein [Streptomyces sp. CC71]NEC75211.1 DUF397 domain-containing protein [Streptomyces rochei]QCB22318.1 DUF397 domain-containing protein [Streptomyces sp. SS52]RSS20988.1 DUF397 domain-containing protein [Streptomyces sp. WAC05458]
MNRKEASGDITDLNWFTSSYSDSSNPNDCVEVAITPATIHVRDSKRPDGPRLTVPPASWTAFVAGVGKA